MDSFRAIAQTLLNRLTASLGTADPAAFVKLVDALSRRRNVFVTADDRADSVALAFVRALVRLQRSVFLVGQPDAPVATRGDLLVVLSSEGRSPVLGARMDLMHRVDGNTVLITADSAAALLPKADLAVLLLPPPRTPYSPKLDTDAAWLLFSEALLLYLDVVSVALAQSLTQQLPPPPGLALS